jgi:hypothetical protein
MIESAFIILIGIGILILLWRFARKTFWALVAVTLLAVVAVALLFMIVEQKDRHHQEEVRRWDWQHYTGYRITQDVVYAGGLNREHGIWTDNKTGKECTDKGYPGYAVCAPQEYVVNGVPSSAPTIDYAALAQQAGGVPVASATAPSKPPKHAKPKTGTIRYESVLYVDTCEHASSKTIPAGSKVKILGRVGIEWTNGCLSTGDLVKVSFDGVTGWVNAIAVLEDIVTPAPEHK